MPSVKAWSVSYLRIKKTSEKGCIVKEKPLHNMSWQWDKKSCDKHHTLLHDIIIISWFQIKKLFCSEQWKYEKLHFQIVSVYTYFQEDIDVNSFLSYIGSSKDKHL